MARNPLKSLKTDWKGRLSDALPGKPALRASSETVITPPHYPGSKSRKITASLLKWLASGFAR